MIHHTGKNDLSLARLLESGKNQERPLIPDHCIEAVVQFDALLVRWNKIINLTRLMNIRDRISFLYQESFWGAMQCPIEGTLVDLGSGCGFPGLAFKLLYPEARVILVESRLRKGHFLKEAIRELKLEGIEVCTERIENLTKSPFCEYQHLSWRAVSLGEEILKRQSEKLPLGGSIIFFGTNRSGDLRQLMSLSGFQCVARILFPLAQERILIRLVKRST
jgi:16S rRNA (guanine(527)-N(7))-methyltransferase RsmG